MSAGTLVFTIIGALALNVLLTYLFGFIGGIISSIMHARKRGIKWASDLDGPYKASLKAGAGWGIAAYYLIVAFIFLVVIL